MEKKTNSFGAFQKKTRDRVSNMSEILLVDYKFMWGFTST